MNWYLQSFCYIEEVGESGVKFEEKFVYHRNRVPQGAVDQPGDKAADNVREAELPHLDAVWRAGVPKWITGEIGQYLGRLFSNLHPSDSDT